jgi:predicted RNase H-like nuclease
MSLPQSLTPPKPREDLLDAAIGVWTAALWWRWGAERRQVLGDQPDALRPAATIIAPARPKQRGQPIPENPSSTRSSSCCRTKGHIA